QGLGARDIRRALGNVEIADLARVHMSPARKFGSSGGQTRRRAGSPARCAGSRRLGGAVDLGELDASGRGRLGDIGAVVLAVPLDSVVDRIVPLPVLVQIGAERDDGVHSAAGGDDVAVPVDVLPDHAVLGTDPAAGAGGQLRARVQHADIGQALGGVEAAD